MERRIEKAEQALQGSGTRVFVCGLGDFDAVKLAAEEAAARAEMGPDDVLVRVVYGPWRQNGPQDGVT